MPGRRPSPSRKSKPAAARLEIPAAIARGVGRLLRGAAGIVAARPVLFAGSAAFLGISAVVSTNALTGQSAAHPQPMLMTRAVDAARAIAALEEGPAETQPWRPTNDPRIMTVPLVKEAQVLLADAGYYQAAIDGRPGQATDRAIRTFQAERGLRVDGMATPLLLTQIRQLTSQTPSPSGRPDGEQYASLDDLMNDLPTGGIDIPILDEEPADPALVRRIQERLDGAAVADLTPDGIMGEKTRAAIRTFQELEGLEVTGEPSEALLARLDAIGSAR